MRLAGCNLRCAWCDTKYALENGQQMSTQAIIQEIGKYPCKNVSITGGEPLLQNAEVLKLITELKVAGYWIQLNTNGTFFDAAIFELVNLVSMDCKCPSSTMASTQAVLAQTEKMLGKKAQFKFVISDEKDFDYAKNVLSRLSPTNAVFQPEWGNKKFARTLVELVKNEGLKVRVILQQHKIIWGARKRGC